MRHVAISIIPVLMFVFGLGIGKELSSMQTAKQCAQHDHFVYENDLFECVYLDGDSDYGLGPELPVPKRIAWKYEA